MLLHAHSCRLYFNPRSPCGERRNGLPGFPGNVSFQSTLPVWGATWCGPRTVGMDLFQSTLPVWGATAKYQAMATKAGNFNPRSPCGERRWQRTSITGRLRFQSTLPVWGATRWVHSIAIKEVYFNPRSPCGERRFRPAAPEGEKMISIHAPRVGSDKGPEFCIQIIEISIHAPRVGSDHGSVDEPCADVNFNPRSPCGERQRHRKNVPIWMTFQSTLPVWGATGNGTGLYVVQMISIHAPRVGSDST